MKICLIFDSWFDTDTFRDLLKKYHSSEVIIFPLVSDPLLLAAVIQHIHAGEHSSVKVINSAQAVSDQVKELRKKICKWSADIGNAEVFSRTVKDWLMVPGCSVSSWWFGLLSEKNTLKTDAYLRMAQIHAVEKLFSCEDPGLCLLSISNRKLHKALTGICQNRHLSVKVIPISRAQSVNHCNSRFFDHLDCLGLLGSFLQGIIAWRHLILRARRARKGLPDFKMRTASARGLLFTSYFPNIDKEAAGKRVFRNKYALALQDKLKAADIPVSWLLMPVPLDGYNFEDAVKLANDFSKNGENLFILEEFLTLKVAIKGFLLWIRQIAVSFFLFDKLKNKYLTAGPVGWQGYPIVQSLWEVSFYGPIAVQGILYSLIFREVFKQISGIRDCLYFCEMHAWEKALNAAKKDINPQIRTIGYQHSSVSNNDLGYFYDRSETVSTGNPSDMPQPDIFACNGQYLYDLLSQSGYSNLTQTEAIRYLYLNNIFTNRLTTRQGRPLLLVAGSYNRNEARALVMLVSRAFPAADQFDIWFKGHPSMPLEEIFAQMGVDYLKAGFVIKHGNISDYLKDAWGVIVSTSTVAMEALGYGCEIIIPVFPDAMLMNPLADFEHYYHNVTTPQELRHVMEKIAGKPSLYNSEKCKDFLTRYWNLDPALPLWSRILEGMKHVPESI
ncbi:MAG: hypothetical protein HQL14_04105 [Candidatus Omnitrophica bacterium]|nr:hypothetical protein [Candidatus Omnitrophota bacterium]